MLHEIYAARKYEVVDWALWHHVEIPTEHSKHGRGCDSLSFFSMTIKMLRFDSICDLFNQAAHLAELDLPLCGIEADVSVGHDQTQAGGSCG